MNLFFLHAPGSGYLNNILIKLGYKIDPNYIKNELFYDYLENKVWFYTKSTILEYFYIFLFVIVFIIIIFFLTFYYLCKNKYKIKKLKK